MNDLTQDGTIIVIVGMATQVLKPLLPKKILPLLTWLCGGVIGGTISGLTNRNIVEGVIRGLVAGAASNGLYSQLKRAKKTPIAED